jgi:hypothetical protein
MAGPTPHSESNSRLAVEITLLLGGILTLISGATCLGFALLRETADFWLHSGGYPLWLRDLVRVTYYPLILGDLLALSALTATLCARLRLAREWVILEILLLGAAWALLAGSLGISAKNNALNFWHNRPIHQKPHAPR